jgi:hypothetical protein
MKLLTNDETEKFTPFTLTLEVESIEEAEQLYFFFQCTNLCEVFEPSKVRKNIREFLERKTNRDLSEKFNAKYDDLKRSL